VETIGHLTTLRIGGRVMLLGILNEKNTSGDHKFSERIEPVTMERGVHEWAVIENPPMHSAIQDFKNHHFSSG